MPELPEVETIRRDLEPLVLGRTIADIAVEEATAPLLLDRSPEAMRTALAGHRIESLTRRGKYLMFALDGDITLVVHLRMTGRLLWRPRSAPPEPFQRASILLDRDDDLRWCDVRKFGTWRIVDDPGVVIAALGAEPLDDTFTAEHLAAALAGRRTPIKSFLLDQRRIAGLGNIYADEALFAAAIHPLTAAGAIPMPAVTRLARACRETLAEAIEHRGSSFSDYVDASGNPGSAHGYVRVFRRIGKPCYVCGSPIERIVVGGRATHFCPTCQPSEAACD